VGQCWKEIGVRLHEDGGRLFSIDGGEIVVGAERREGTGVSLLKWYSHVARPVRVELAGELYHFETGSAVQRNNPTSKPGSSVAHSLSREDRG
jgi:hypothetical protein